MSATTDIQEGNCIRNHNGGRGEIGAMLNHTVYQEGTIGTILLNHTLDDGAPKATQVTQFECDEVSLARTLGLYSYPIRSFVISNPGDIFQIGEELRPGLDWMVDHFNRVGIPCAQDFIYHYDFLAEEYLDYKLSVFFFGKEAHQSRPDEERFIATQLFNDKNNVIEMARNLGMRIPRTETFSFAGEVDLSRYRHAKFPLAVKIANSVSGLGFEKCYSYEQLVCAIEKISMIPMETPFQIQEFLHGAKFLSAQWWINGPGDIIPITGTQNFIEGDANHAGNWGGKNIPHEALACFTRQIALHGSVVGLRDWIGFDVALHENSFYLIECNPRYTGAAYPYAALRKLFGNKAREKFWAHRSYSVNRDSIDGFHLNGLEFDSKRQEGWIVINPGPLTVGDGKVGMLWIGPEDGYAKAEDDIRNLLS